MDLHYSQTSPCSPEKRPSFTTLWIYTILKQFLVINRTGQRFTTLWIYTILKLQGAVIIPFLRFTTLWIYTILKPNTFLHSFHH